eukprot:14186627-Alexandrium_andersonii.AAC.1
MLNKFACPLPTASARGHGGRAGGGQDGPADHVAADGLDPGGPDDDGVLEAELANIMEAAAGGMFEETDDESELDEALPGEAPE